MSDSIILYKAAFAAGDTNSSANAYVKRLADKSVNVGNINGLVAALQSLLLGASASLTSNASLDLTTTLAICDATAGAMTVTLPPVASCAGAVKVITKTDTSGNTVTVAGNGSELIVTPAVGAGANTYTGLSARGKILVLICDGVVWRGGQLAN